ncbi:hypothetical protein [Deinococcus ruber]|uniref:SnoaL-like domain-containing protein n=1 Tax=Deinococcus ruber TaxID=1848197 RepID=A0A918F5T8_9DEIO|nr:hypothetical protein [Deinococcus ruber]GGR03775.1 hypothetical protein GCM10008957_15890 [Deinococcus ruber]
MTADVQTFPALQAAEIEALAREWYHKLDVHAPMVELLPMLADDGLEMVFPEATVYGYAGFEGWYQTVIRVFFDEKHTVKVVEPQIDGQTAKVKVIVHWEASAWKAPGATSDRYAMDADQSWEVARNAAGAVVVTRYVVNGMTYDEGSKHL